MSFLEHARRVYARLQAQRNGRPEAALSHLSGCEKSEKSEKRVDAGPTYHLVSNPAELQSVQWALDETDVVGLDVEATGLDPRQHRTRLLSLATDRGTWLVDCFRVDPRPLWELLAEKTIIAHNAAYDLSMLRVLGFEPGAVRDTMLLSQLLYGTRKPKGFHTLAGCVERELGRQVDKKEQRSDWSGTLTPSQLQYAALDADVLPPLYRALEGKARARGLAAVAAIEQRCLPAFVWLSLSGVKFDLEAWQRLALGVSEEARQLALELDALAPPLEQPEMFGGGWDWNSPQQVQRVFQALGFPVQDTKDQQLAKISHPLAGLLREYRAATKRAGTYGPDWSKFVAGAGRIYAEWRQIGTITGRTAAAGPNLQQVPKEKTYRRCFVAPPGRLLVKCDYSQIQLRIAAKISGDRAMLAAYRDGQDLHALTAQQVLKVDKATGEQRKLAKAVNFGLVFGMGPRGFQSYAKSNYGLDLSEQEAADYRAAFFRAYPGLKSWHVRTSQEEKRGVLETWTLAGRLIPLTEKTRYTDRLNYPVQGTEADGLKRAMGLLWERRAEVPGAFPVLVVHDELVFECDRDQAETVAAWLQWAMVESLADWLAPIPVEAEVKSASTWGGDPQG